MDGYRRREGGQELRYVKEMGQTCAAPECTSLCTPHIALAVGTLAADDSAGVFSSAGCWLPDAFGHFGLRKREDGEVRWNHWGNPLSNSIQLCLTLSNQHTHYILRFAYLGLFSTSTTKGRYRASGHDVKKLNIRGMNHAFWLHCTFGLGCSSCGASTSRHAITSLQPGGKSLFNSSSKEVAAVGLGTVSTLACAMSGRMWQDRMIGISGWLDDRMDAGWDGGVGFQSKDARLKKEWLPNTMNW